MTPQLKHANHIGEAAGSGNPFKPVGNPTTVSETEQISL